MRRLLKALGKLSLILGLIALAFYIAIGNYQECRAAKFSRTYCAFTHLVH